MKKQVILRALLGFPIGIAIGYIITIIISLIFAQGYYSPCVPDLVETMGSEIGAVILQSILCGLLGSSFAATSVIWEIDRLSIAKQTGVYFLINSVVMMPIAYFTNWMEHSLVGFIVYFSIFIAIFFVVWIVQYFIWKDKIRKMNLKINRY